MFLPHYRSGQAKTSSGLDSLVDSCFILELAVRDVCGEVRSSCGFKLRREAGVSEAEDRCLNPEQSAAESKDLQ
jgi:hypothetical protein